MRYTIWRQIRLMLVVFVGYLLHVTAMNELQIGGSSIHLLLVILSVVIVGYNRHRAFWTGAFYGIVMETMLPGVKLMNLVFYPICALLMTLFFTDKSAARLQYEMSNHRRGRNTSVYLRTPLCAMFSTALYEAVTLIYINISYAEMSQSFITQALGNVFWTTVATIVLMWPIRRLLGFTAPLSRAMSS